MKKNEMKNESPLVQCRRLVRQFGEAPGISALKGVDLKVNRREFLSIMGPSGSGKTTLLNLIGTLDQPNSGAITVDGTDVLQLKSNALADFRRRNIGFVFQLFNLVPTLSAIENVILPLIPYQRGLEFNIKDRGEALLNLVGLQDRMTHIPAELSGGEQQRVAVARALINQPSLILADEPTGNLDTKTGDDVMELLSALKTDHELSIIVATHSPRVAAFADRAYFLRDGLVVDESTLETEEAIKANPIPSANHQLPGKGKSA